MNEVPALIDRHRGVLWAALLAPSALPALGLALSGINGVSEGGLHSEADRAALAEALLFLIESYLTTWAGGVPAYVLVARRGVRGWRRAAATAGGSALACAGCAVWLTGHVSTLESAFLALLYGLYSFVLALPTAWIFVVLVRRLGPAGGDA